jgi:hypothetical protein
MKKTLHHYFKEKYTYCDNEIDSQGNSKTSELSVVEMARTW